MCFGEIDRLAAHLVPDAVDVLRAARHLGVQHAGRGQLAFQAIGRLADEEFALAALLVQMTGNVLVDLGVEETEGQVFQFPLQLPDAEPVGQRRIELERLARNRYAQVVGFGGKVAQGLRSRSQAEEDDANILDGSEQHLA